MKTSMKIKIDDLSSDNIRALIMEHLNDMHEWSPPGSVHALDIHALQDPTITVWSAWEGPELVGCGALRKISATHGEIKSMRTATAHRGKGIAKALLTHIIKEARARGYNRLSLETGSMLAFKAAQELYKAAGFQYCEPFAEYPEDPNSVFMTLLFE